MKIGILKNRNQFGHIGGSDTYLHLLIENVDDVLLYNKYLSQLRAQETSDLWFGFKSQTFRKSISDYMVHELNSSVETKLLAFTLDNKQSETDLFEYCQIADSIVNKKIESILKFINLGHIVRINNVGGYCYINKQELENYDEVFEPTIEQFIQFLNIGDIEIKSVQINNKTIIIENSNTICSSFKIKLDTYLDINDIYEFINFKNAIRVYKDKEIIDIFCDAIKNGLENICFDTTGQDLNQVRKMEILLNQVETFSNRKLNLYISTYNKNVLEIFKNYNVIKIDRYGKI